MKKISFYIHDIAWFRTVLWPDIPEDMRDTSDPDAFSCIYTLEEGPNGLFYELEVNDGRTNYNDLNGYEKMCLRECDSYFENRLHIVGCPDFCMAMNVDGHITPAHGDAFAFADRIAAQEVRNA